MANTDNQNHSPEEPGREKIHFEDFDSQVEKGLGSQPGLVPGFLRRAFTRPALWVILISVVAAILTGRYYQPVWTIEAQSLDTQKNQKGKYYYIHREEPVVIEDLKSKPTLTRELAARLTTEGTWPQTQTEFVRIKKGDREEIRQISLKRHFNAWSLLPALTAILLCWITREALISLFMGALVGGFLLGKYDFIEEVFLPAMTLKSAAGVLVLYLVLLGALMGIWSRTGGPRAFAEMATRKFVRGPKSARVVSWLLGVIFFQGGTISSVLVGTTVKPIADKQKISHEELSYIVDSTSAPIATLLAFNAWPGYVQSFLFVAGVPFLATEATRLEFFFSSIPLNFYAWFAVAGTLLFSLDRAPFLGKKFRAAMERSRAGKGLDAPGARPLSTRELEVSHVPDHYRPWVGDFGLPLFVLLGICLGTFFATGSPEVRLAFSLAVLTAAFLALARGMSLSDLMIGVGEGLKGVVFGAMILLMAITIGQISQETGAGIYFVDLLSGRLPWFLVPLVFQVLTMVIAFSTGTSWGTYAVAFPLAMPLAWAVAQSPEVSNPELFMMICFASVMNGSIYGDQCSPISDTTILSSMSTGCDLMDHVKTQIVPATAAAVLAALSWLMVTLIFV